jgi:hypothetical protein
MRQPKLEKVETYEQKVQRRQLRTQSKKTAGFSGGRQKANAIKFGYLCPVTRPCWAVGLNLSSYYHQRLATIGADLARFAPYANQFRHSLEEMGKVESPAGIHPPLNIIGDFFYAPSLRVDVAGWRLLLSAQCCTRYSSVARLPLLPRQQPNAPSGISPCAAAVAAASTATANSAVYSRP